MGARSKIIATTIAVMAVGGVVAPSAQAAVGDCNSGNACMWQDLSYTGGLAQYADGVKLGLIWNNQPTSVKSNGNANCARFWDNTDYTGAYIYFSRPARQGIYQDPDLQNGGGYGPHNQEYWNDRIGSQNWQQCPSV